jgi:uncharacterized repeat protein (TIGR03847 family)
MTIELGSAQQIDAQAYGEPGQRTFRLRIVGQEQQAASLWVEKEQVQALSMAFSQVLSQLNRDAEAPVKDIAEFPERPNYEFRVGRMAIGLDPADNALVLNFFELGPANEDDDTAEPDLRVRCTQEQCASLNTRLREIIAGGRPLCPLCGVAMAEQGHACIRANGHSSQPIPQDDEDGE